eukprot:533565_1
MYGKSTIAVFLTSLVVINAVLAEKYVFLTQIAPNDLKCSWVKSPNQDLTEYKLGLGLFNPQNNEITENSLVKEGASSTEHIFHSDTTFSNNLKYYCWVNDGDSLQRSDKISLSPVVEAQEDTIEEIVDGGSSGNGAQLMQDIVIVEDAAENENINDRSEVLDTSKVNAPDGQTKEDDTILFWLWTSISIGYFSLILLAVVAWIVTYSKKRKKAAAKKKAL